jgi:hypothetical protein
VRLQNTASLMPFPLRVQAIPLLHQALQRSQGLSLGDDLWEHWRSGEAAHALAGGIRLQVCQL